MSETERKIKEDAIATKRAVSALNFFGTKIPKRRIVKRLRHILHE